VHSTTGENGEGKQIVGLVRRGGNVSRVGERFAPPGLISRTLTTPFNRFVLIRRYLLLQIYDNQQQKSNTCLVPESKFRILLQQLSLADKSAKLDIGNIVF
jgi:hypothetical protein